MAGCWESPPWAKRKAYWHGFPSSNTKCLCGRLDLPAWEKCLIWWCESSHQVCTTISFLITFHHYLFESLHFTLSLTCLVEQPISLCISKWYNSYQYKVNTMLAALLSKLEDAEPYDEYLNFPGRRKWWENMFKIWSSLLHSLGFVVSENNNPIVGCHWK
jgi:hypothetical protein